jgi:hypothetical protein
MGRRRRVARCTGWRSVSIKCSVRRTTACESGGVAGEGRPWHTVQQSLGEQVGENFSGLRISAFLGADR